LKGEKGGTFMVCPRRHLASLRHWQSESMTSSIWHLTNFCAWHLPTDAEHKSGQDVRSNVFQIFSMTRHGIESGLPALVALVQSTAEISRFCVKQCYANICQNFKQNF